jgi:hypothetical protein
MRNKHSESQHAIGQRHTDDKTIATTSPVLRTLTYAEQITYEKSIALRDGEVVLSQQGYGN